MIFDWFTSDLHFGHKAIIDFCHRPFNSVEEMNEALLENYNSHVGYGDTVCFVGDIFFGSQAWAKELLGRMHGEKILVRGNHDRKSRAMAKLGFDLVVKELVMDWAGCPVRVCHYPWKKLNGGEWETMGREGDHRHVGWHPRYSPVEILLHGHTHEMTRRSGNMIHVGVDAWDYRPASREEILKLIGETEL